VVLFLRSYPEHPDCSPYDKKRFLPTDGEESAANMKERRGDWWTKFCVMHPEHPDCSQYNKKRSLAKEFSMEGKKSATKKKERESTRL
jgi:hypothetical protein